MVSGVLTCLWTNLWAPDKIIRVVATWEIVQPKTSFWDHVGGVEMGQAPKKDVLDWVDVYNPIQKDPMDVGRWGWHEEVLQDFISRFTNKMHVHKALYIFKRNSIFIKEGDNLLTSSMMKPVITVGFWTILSDLVKGWWYRGHNMRIHPWWR